MIRKAASSLDPEQKQRLIRQALERRNQRAEGPQAAPEPVKPAVLAPADIPPKYYRFHLHSGYLQLRLISDGAGKLGIASPYFKVHDGIAGATTRIAGDDYVNYASYNYLGYCGDSRISHAAKAAIDRWGTSVSASRLVSGERDVHRALERALAQAYDVDDAIAFVSGHATNVTAIGYLFGPKDLILHDALVHNSVLQGIKLSGAQRLPFPHNDWATLDEMLTAQRRRFERVLIVVEGIFSMDGDYPELPRFVELKQRHGAFLMVDEAHSLGVMGQTGLGIREHFGLAGADVDIWMGTLSKALASCGGYIAGEVALIEHLKFLAPGFLYSVGMTPSAAASALAALQLMRKEPQRVAALQARGLQFRDEARAAGIDVGLSTGLAIVPALTGSSVRALKLSQALFERGIHVQPILYPAVPENAARLRFFIGCEHTEAQITETVQALKQEFARL
jgi:8-amino-7-oxononanoate synthase